MPSPLFEDISLWLSVVAVREMVLARQARPERLSPGLAVQASDNQAGASTWITRLAINSLDFAA